MSHDMLIAKGNKLTGCTMSYRLQINIADGITYLHAGCNMPAMCMAVLAYLQALLPGRALSCRSGNWPLYPKPFEEGCLLQHLAKLAATWHQLCRCVYQCCLLEAAMQSL